MDVDAVAFDLYGTLLEVASVGRAAAEVTLEPAVLVDLWRQKQLEYTWLRSLMGRYQDFWATTGDALDYSLDRLGIVVDDATRSRLLGAWLDVRPYPEVPEALEALAPRRLAVLSNGNPGMLEAGLAAAGIRGRFHHVLSVDELGFYKPHPSVYESGAQGLRPAGRADPVRLLQRLGRLRGQSVRPAGGLGEPRRRAARTARGPPDLVVANLAQLAAGVVPGGALSKAPAEEPHL